ncbi:hypothetical protein ONE63_011280 [Megalurothrips usitatus]|uniref:Transposase domain-containing protein n=1 Tax=Megalurothrips usitatus TaxID=439358 RepID=A0AAV7X3M4_9NEOP|nr:hypothetical protein ONE63_011280 [Megalurothrips usitatus]
MEDIDHLIGSSFNETQLLCGAGDGSSSPSSSSASSSSRSESSSHSISRSSIGSAETSSSNGSIGDQEQIFDNEENSEDGKNADNEDNEEGRNENNNQVEDHNDNEGDGEVNQQNADNGDNGHDRQEDDEGPEERAEDARQPESHPLLRAMLDDPDFVENVRTEVNVSKLDLLYMVLGSAQQNNYTNKAFNDAVTLINNIFSSPVLPTSRYLLDKVIMNHDKTKFYFYCSSCSSGFGQLDYMHIKEKQCDRCNTVSKISDLRAAHFFCLYDIPSQLEALFNRVEVREALLTPSEAVRKCEPGFYSDIYDGSVFVDFEARIATEHVDEDHHIISSHFCTDGSPLFTSSKCSIWPISLAINELPPVMRMRNLLLPGLWFGTQKPPMDLFLEPFVNHMQEISVGFQINVNNSVWQMKLFNLGCCVDSGARGPVQGIKTHSGYNSCAWCYIHGVYLEGAVKFPLGDIVPPKRTHEGMIRLQLELDNRHAENLDDISDEESGGENADGDRGVNAVSPLINMPNFNMVDGFFVDSMHLLHLGITKYFLTKWTGDCNEDYYILLSADVINKRISSMRPPVELRRLARELDEKPRWKAREFENWLLFYCAVVLKGILPNKYIDIWLLLAQAVHILSSTKISHDHLNIADALIKKFLIETQEAYGEVSMVYNLHILYHLPEHVARWGPLGTSSAYCFENFNGVLKRVIKSQQGIPNQVVRAMSWDQAKNILRPHVSDKARSYVASLSKSKDKGIRVGSLSVLVGKSEVFSPDENERWLCENSGQNVDGDSCEVFKRLIQDKCVYATDNHKRKTNNSVALLKDNRVVLIHKIVYDRSSDAVFLIVSDVHLMIIMNGAEVVNLHPSEHLLRKITFIEEEKKFLSCDQLKVVCFRSTFQHGDYVSPIPNIYNVF